MSLDSAIFAPLPAIELAIAASLQGFPSTPKLTAAMHYAATGGGKRLRPLLAWHSAVAVGGDGACSLPAAVPLELVHCFSLVHDDLPALDNDDLRRGKLTLHKHAGEAMAILAGDALLTQALTLLARVQPASLAMLLLTDIGDATLAMIAGQVGDTEHDVPAEIAAGTDLARLQWVHRNKTGALLRASCVMGARLAGASPAQLASLASFASSAGLLFQAVDDLLDVTQTADHTGKRTNKDTDAGKLTYPALLGIEGTQQAIATLEREALQALAPLGSNAEGLRLLLNFLAWRTK
jgi:geranylgeranyl pyrophosphate synthase